jgi:hopanoid biosynthesis associated protein HpnK
MGPSHPITGFEPVALIPDNPRRFSAPNLAARRLVVNADDFGKSPSINTAVVRAHREGILTTASLMVNEHGCAEAVRLAKENPRMGVGLHLALLCGRSALPHSRIPGLVDKNGIFPSNPAAVGFRYYFQQGLCEQLRAEIHAQFGKFRETGLPLDHVNGHLHLHLHPVVFDILMEDANQLGIERIRLTRDFFRANLRLARGRLGYRLLHAVVFWILAKRSRGEVSRRGMRHTSAVFGLLQNAYVDEKFILGLLPSLPAGDSELYSHPSLDEFKNEFEALISPRVIEEARKQGIQLIRYQDL